MTEPFECVYRIRRRDTGQWWSGGRTWSGSAMNFPALSSARRTISRCAAQFRGIPLEIVSFQIVPLRIHCVDDEGIE